MTNDELMNLLHQAELAARQGRRQVRFIRSSAEERGIRRQAYQELADTLRSGMLFTLAALAEHGEDEACNAALATVGKLQDVTRSFIGGTLPMA